MKIAITGEKGFLGQHLTFAAKYKFNIDIIELDRDYLDNIYKVENCDWLIHCAGVNRGDTVKQDNINLAQELISKLSSLKLKTNIVFISSVQEDLDNDYGVSKKACKELLQDYCRTNNTEFLSFKIPNLFGPFGKPNYNSVVATFCYNIANKLDVQVNTNATVDLAYVQDVTDNILKFSKNVEFQTTTITIQELKNYIDNFSKKYKEGIIPKLSSKFEIDLFNTFRSYVKPEHTFQRFTDDRGYLIELLKSEQSQTQVFFSTTKPGITRGNHFHFSKVERFCILKGTARIQMRKVGSDTINTYIISEDSNKVIDMPVLFTHNITNVGLDELVCVFWTNEIFNNLKPDTFYEEVYSTPIS